MTNQHINIGFSPTTTISNVSFQYCLLKEYFTIFHQLPIHCTFLSYDKSFVTPQGKMLFEINVNTQMNLKRNHFPVLEMEIWKAVQS